MQRIPVDSSNIASIGYDAQAQVLEIEFRRKGQEQGPVYQYLQVPLEVWEGLLDSPSKGKYFSDQIKGRYPYRKVSD